MPNNDKTIVMLDTVEYPLSARPARGESRRNIIKLDKGATLTIPAEHADKLIGMGFAAEADQD